MMLGCINVNVIDAKASSFTLSANNDNSANDGLGAVDLDWSSYSKKNVMFKGYQSKDGGKTWQTISLMDYTRNKGITNISNRKCKRTIKNMDGDKWIRQRYH